MNTYSVQKNLCYVLSFQNKIKWILALTSAVKYNYLKKNYSKYNTSIKILNIL